MLELIAVRSFGKGKWVIHYEHTCDCGCERSRHILTLYQKKKPTDSQAKQLIDENYNK